MAAGKRIKRKWNPFATGGGDKDTTTITVGAEAGNAISVTVQLKDSNGNNPAEITHVKCWFSDSATTGAIIATAPSGTVLAGVGQLLADIGAAKKIFEVLTNATGAFRLDIGEAGAKTFYLYVKLDDGRVKISPAITFV